MANFWEAHGKPAWDAVRPIAPELTIYLAFYAAAGFFGPHFLDGADSWAKLVAFAAYGGGGLILARSLVVRIRALRP